MQVLLLGAGSASCRNRRFWRCTPATTAIITAVCCCCPLQAADLEKARLADSAAALGEKCAGLEQELKTARESLASLRAVADQVTTGTLMVEKRKLSVCQLQCNTCVRCDKLKA